MNNEHEVHADDEHADTDAQFRRDVRRGLVLLRRDVAAIQASQQKAPPWLAKWVGGPRDIAMWLLLGAALIGRGDIQGVLAAVAAWNAARAPSVVSTPVAPPSPALETAP